MALTISENSTTDYTPPEAGTFSARCASIIDMGSQTSVFEGESKTAHKVLVTFEITDTDNRRSDGSPHTVSKRFTASLHTKAALRKFLEAWRGKPFTPQELAGFDLKNVLGLHCLVGIVHDTKGDKTYANMASVMKLPKGMPAGAGVLPVVSFDLSAPDWQVFAGLSSRLQASIAESPEYLAIPNKPRTISVGATPVPTTTTPPPVQQPEPPAYTREFAPAAPAGTFDPDMDIPF